MLSQVCECPNPTPCRKGGIPPEFPTVIGFTAGWRGSPALTGSMLVMAAFAVTRGGRTQEGRVSAGPAKQSPHCLAERTHRKASISFPSNLPLPCHMIWPVCNNTQGAEAGRSGNEMIHCWQLRHTAATYLLLLCCKNNLSLPCVGMHVCACASTRARSKWTLISEQIGGWR